MRIYLVGFMAAGKTVVGSALARRLGTRFEDLDRAIEVRAGLRVHEIFDRDGEARFRDLEHECLRDTAALEDAVIGTGGGTMTFERNREAMRRLGVTVWLAPPFETLLARLARKGGSARPLFRDREQARALYSRRVEAYRMADVEVKPAAGDTAEEVAATIAGVLRERHCAI